MEGYVIGIFILPFTLGFLWLITPRLPLRQARAQTIGLWALVCPGLLVLFFGHATYEDGISSIVSHVTEYSVDAIAVDLLAWIAMTTLFAVFVGLAYGLTTGSIRVRERYRRVTIAAILVVVLIPVAVGAALPIDDGDNGYDSDISSNEGDELEDSIEPVEDEDDASDDLEAGSEPTPDYTQYSHWWVSGPDGADFLVNESADEPPEPLFIPYNVTETHVEPAAFDLRTVQLDDGNGTVDIDGHYYVSYQFADGEDVPHDAVVNSGTLDEQPADGHEHYFIRTGTPKDADGIVAMEHTKSMWIYFDAVTEDGEVERYIVGLER